MSVEAPRSPEDLRRARVELEITGMTCAACANRIERALNKLDGVSATVNYATEVASVEFDPLTQRPDSLTAAVTGAGYGASVSTPARHRSVAAPTTAPDPTRDLRDRVLICAVLGVPVIVLSMVGAWEFRNWQWLALTLAAPVAVWGAWPFHRAAVLNARHGQATMDTLVSVGVAASFGWSVWALFFGDAGKVGAMDMAHGSASSQLYLEVATATTVLVLVGRFAEARSKRAAGSALRALAELSASEAVLLDGSVERLVAIEAVGVGADLVVRAGERIPTDAVVLTGQSAVDNAMVTGESVPVDVGPGDAVTGGTVNLTGRLVVRATRIGADTSLARIGRLVNEAQTGKAPVQRLADRVSSVFVPVVIVIALVTLSAWLVTGHGAGDSFRSAVAVLIIACPCALGLATPTALLVGTGRGAQLGLLIRGPQVLEAARAIDIVVFDKTGTITTGDMSVVTVSADDADEVRRVAAALEAISTHPVARAVVADATARLGLIPPGDALEEVPGGGVRGVVGGRASLAGRAGFVSESCGALDARWAEAIEQARESGHTEVLVGWDGQVHGVIAVADTVKPTSRAAVTRLRELGLHPVLLSGDHQAAADRVAAEVGIDDVIAEVAPADKVAAVRQLQEGGHQVAMVGDGVNDAAALAQADLGIAMSSGSDVAIESSDITLVRSDLSAVPDAIALSRRTLAVIRGNLFWAFGYNIAAIPLAASGRLSPVIAAGAMAFSSVLVVTNSLRLRGFRPAPSNPGSVG